MKIQSISKLFLLILIMFLTVFLGSCSDKDFRIEYYYSKEEKQEFVEYFKEYNEMKNCYYIEVELTYPVKGEKLTHDYKLYYSYQIKEDGTIVVRGQNSYKSSSYFEYIYNNDILTVNELESISVGDNKIISTQEKRITKEEFLNTYKLDELFSYSMDFSQAEYYKKIKTYILNQRTIEYHFDFNENDKLCINMDDIELVLTNIKCYISYINRIHSFNFRNKLELEYRIDGFLYNGYWKIYKGESK